MKTKIWLITAAALVLIGGVLFVGVMSALDWDFSVLSTVKYETNAYEINEAFDGISIKTNTADVVLLPSDDGKTKVVCCEEENLSHTVSVKDGKLTVELTDSRSLRDFIGLSIGASKITVYLPERAYASLSIYGHTADASIPADFTFASVDISLSTGDVSLRASVSDNVKIKTSTGDIRIENISAGALDISSSTGEAELVNIVCKSVVSSGSTGDILLKNVVAAERISIERSTADVEFDGSDAAEIYVRTSTGDVEGSLLSGKDFKPQSKTGDVEVPRSTGGGICEIITSTGDIEITVE